MTARSTTKAIMAMILLLFAAGAAQADPPGMTGTWSGVAPCEELADGEYTFEEFPEGDFRIIQNGNTLRAAGFGVVYEGTIQVLKGGPNDGEAILNACGGAVDGETARIRHIVLKGGEAKFDANSIFVIEDPPTYATCTWVFTRVSTDEPEIPPCD